MIGRFLCWLGFHRPSRLLLKWGTFPGIYYYESDCERCHTPLAGVTRYLRTLPERDDGDEEEDEAGT